MTDDSIKKVLLVCDQVYAEKADKRAGGVGTEAQIISPKLYAQTHLTKFVAVVREKNAENKPYVPVYYHGRIHIDLTSDETYAQNFEQLVRWIFDKPVNIKPEIGTPPSFVTHSTAAVTFGSAAARFRAAEALRSAKPEMQQGHSKSISNPAWQRWRSLGSSPTTIPHSTKRSLTTSRPLRSPATT